MSSSPNRQADWTGSGPSQPCGMRRCDQTAVSISVAFKNTKSPFFGRAACPYASVLCFVLDNSSIYSNTACRLACTSSEDFHWAEEEPLKRVRVPLASPEEEFTLLGSGFDVEQSEPDFNERI